MASSDQIEEIRRIQHARWLAQKQSAATRADRDTSTGSLETGQTTTTLVTDAHAEIQVAHDEPTRKAHPLGIPPVPPLPVNPSPEQLAGVVDEDATEDEVEEVDEIRVIGEARRAPGAAARKAAPSAKPPSAGLKRPLPPIAGFPSLAADLMGVDEVSIPSPSKERARSPLRRFWVSTDNAGGKLKIPKSAGPGKVAKASEGEAPESPISRPAKQIRLGQRTTVRPGGPLPKSRTEPQQAKLIESPPIVEVASSASNNSVPVPTTLIPPSPGSVGISLFSEQDAVLQKKKEVRVFPQLQEPPVTLLSWNIDGLWETGVEARVFSFIDIVRIKRPTVIFLQEITGLVQRMISRILSGPYQIVVPSETTNFVPEGLAHLGQGTNSKIPYYCLMLVSKEHYRILKPQPSINPTSFQTAGGVKWSETPPIEGQTYFYPTSQMGRHYLQVQVELVKPPRTILTLATSHLESTRECASERQYQLEQCLVALSETPPIVDSRGVTIFGGDLNLREQDLKQIGETFEDLGCRDIWEGLGRPPHCQYTWHLRLEDGRMLNHVKARFDRLFIMRGPHDKIRPKAMRLIGTEVIDRKLYNFRISDHLGIYVEFALD